MAVMRVALMVVVVSGLGALCSGQCLRRKPVARVEFQNGVPLIVSSGCLDEFDKHREEGATWQTSNCMRCSCSDGTVFCCNIAFRPVRGFPSDCEPLLDTRQCVYTVVKKRNHRVACPMTGPQSAVGK